MDSSLVWWTGEFSDRVERWINDNHPLYIQEWLQGLTEERKYFKSAGQRVWTGSSTKIGQARSQGTFLDRSGEKHITYRTKSITGWVPFERQPKQDFSDCMFEAAKEIANQGKTIDLFWSGGLDSNAGLLTFNELGLHKQLRLIIGGYMESPDIFEKYVKGRIEYVWDEEGTQNKLFSIAKPDEHVICSMGEACPMYGVKSNFSGRGIVVKDKDSAWDFKRRYFTQHSTFRYIANFDAPWIDINNYKPYFLSEGLEKWLINHVLDGEMMYYDLTDDGWGEHGNEWYKTGRKPDAPYQDYYRTCKMALRHHLYKISGDKYKSYIQPKEASGVRLKQTGPLRNIAVTGEGVVITHENFDEFDWSEYIPDL